MKVKLKKTAQSNSQIDTFIEKVLSATTDNLATVLANFKWIYDKVSDINLGTLTFEDVSLRHASHTSMIACHGPQSDTTRSEAILVN